MTIKTAAPRVRSFADGDPKAPGSPWGPTQQLTDHPSLRGVRIVSTAGHGGMGIADGIARKVLSPAAYKIGEKYGGYVWFEEDVAVGIPLLEHPEWYQLLMGRPFSDAQIAMNERSVRQSYPRYFKMREEGYALPPKLRLGDVLQIALPIELSRGTKLNPGDTLQVVKLTPTYLYGVSPRIPNLRVKLPIAYYLGATGWGTLEDQVYLTKMASPSSVAARKLSAR